MKKIILASIMALVSVFETTNTVSASETIYTSMPNTDDAYYQPFRTELNQFNRDLQSNTDSQD